MSKWREQFEKEMGKRWFTNPVCHGELGFASWEYQEYLETKLDELEAENKRLKENKKYKSNIENALEEGVDY